MAEATFYQLDGEPPESVLPRLLELSLGRGWRVELRGADRARMERLDLALWGEGSDFLPHGVSGGPHDAAQPVLLTAEGDGDSGRDCLMTLDGAALSVEEARRAARVCVVFDGSDEATLAAARAQWRMLTAARLPARFFVREGAGWSLRAERAASPPAP